MAKVRLKKPDNAKERNLLKGAIRRVFSRSELRRRALQASVTDHIDPNRKRVTRWSICPICNKKVPAYLMEVDHIDPIIPMDSSLEQMNWDELISRMWCDERNLQAVCKDCHKIKTKEEQKERKKLRGKK